MQDSLYDKTTNGDAYISDTNFLFRFGERKRYKYIRFLTERVIDGKNVVHLYWNNSCLLVLYACIRRRVKNC